MIGDFRVVRRLGEGGMGEVDAASRGRRSAPVAIKVIKPGMDTRRVSRDSSRAPGPGAHGSPQHRPRLRRGHDRQGRPTSPWRRRAADHRVLRRQRLSVARALELFARCARASSTRTRRASSTVTSSPRNMLVTRRTAADAEGHRLRRRQGDAPRLTSGRSTPNWGR